MKVPAVVRIEPASSCNLRCIHCPTGLGMAPKGIMQKEVFEKVVSELKSFASEISIVVLYHGGEPLLNKNLIDYIKDLKNVGVKKVKTVTNGKLLTDELCLQIVKSGLDEIEISLDGVSGEDSDSIRLKSNSNEVLAAVKKLLDFRTQEESDLRISVATVQFVDDYFQSFEKVGNSPTPEWLNSRFPEGINFKSCWGVQWPGGYPDSLSIVHHEPILSRPAGCSMLDETITIRANGDVVLCCYDLTSLLVVGNVKSSGVLEIWNSQNYENIREDFKVGRYSEPCKSCAVVTGKKFLGKRTLIPVS